MQKTRSALTVVFLLYREFTQPEPLKEGSHGLGPAEQVQIVLWNLVVDVECGNEKIPEGQVESREA